MTAERELTCCCLLLCSPRNRLQDAALEQLDGLHQSVRRRHPGALHEREEKSQRRRDSQLQGPQGDPRLQRSSLLGGTTESQRAGRSGVKKKEKAELIGGKAL